MRKLAIWIGITGLLHLPLIIAGVIFVVSASGAWSLITGITLMFFGVVSIIAVFVLSIVLLAKYSATNGYAIAVGICGILVPLVGGIMAFFLYDEEPKQIKREPQPSTVSLDS